MLKGFKEFLARGNIIDLSVAVVIGTAFTDLVTKFTESLIRPLVDRIGAGGKSDVGILKISIGGGQFIDFNVEYVRRHQLHHHRGGDVLLGASRNAEALQHAAPTSCERNQQAEDTNWNDVGSARRIRAVCGESVNARVFMSDSSPAGESIVVWGHVVPQPLLSIVGVSARVRITLI